MENENLDVNQPQTQETQQENDVCTTPVCDAKPIETPSSAKRDDKKDDIVGNMAKEIASLRSELQKSNIKSALAERRLVPHDAELVSKMVVEKIDSGLSPDEACASLYQSHPYLFKNTTSPKVSETARAEEEKIQKDLNDRLVSSAISRLRRDTVNL